MSAKLTRNEEMALEAWRYTDRDFDVLSFAEIANRSKLDRSLVRRTVRRMARNGITSFHRGCWTVDGEPAGSGYGLTSAGRTALASIEEPEE